MHGAQPLDLRDKREMVWREIERLASLDLVRRGLPAGAVERAAVEGFRRHQAGGRLPRIERGSGGIAIDIDHGARERGMHRGRAVLDLSGAWKSHPCAAAMSSIAITFTAFSAMAASRRAPCADIATWSS